MNIQKKILAHLPRCYAVAAFPIFGQQTILCATEGEGACLAFTGDNFETQRTVWDGPGGTMAIVPIPGKRGEFLAIQKFFKLFQWDKAVIAWVKPQKDGSFLSKEILQLPYIHRFGLFEAGACIHFLGCTLADSKETRDDWSKPGRVYAGILPLDWDKQLQLEVIKNDLYRNHGFALCNWKRKEACLVTSDEGAFAFSPPQANGDSWIIEQVMKGNISDIAACDLDGDGQNELVTIEPWHGEYLRAYKKLGNTYQRIYEYPEVAPFYHVVVATTLRGKPAVICAGRRGSQSLLYLTAKSTSPFALQAVTIDEGVGPSNVAVLHELSRDIIISANREKGEFALYFVSD